VLKQRVITALVLFVALVVALVWSPFAFATLMTLAIAIAQAEWLQLAGWKFSVALATTLSVGALLLGVLLYRPEWFDTLVVPTLVVATLAWILIGARLLLSGPQPPRFHPTLSVVLAFLLPLAAWCAVVLLLRSGVVVLLSVFFIVWVADTAAYFAGRAFGKRKLAPQISPGKTWAGLWGAMIAVILIAVAAQAIAPEAVIFSSRLIARAGVVFALALLATLVALSVIGDLFESLLKRQAGAKDSGHLLPGHGGFYDRLDAMLALLPPAALLWRWVQ